MAQLIWKAFFECVEFGAGVCDVVSEKGAKQPYILGDYETY